jgi:hypothetical protein
LSLLFVRSVPWLIVRTSAIYRASWRFLASRLIRHTFRLGRFVLDDLELMTQGITVDPHVGREVSALFQAEGRRF